MGIIGSKNATREAFKNGTIENGESWMDMIRARNLTSHTYNTNVAVDIVKDILMWFYPAFAQMEKRFIRLCQQEDFEA